MHPLRTMRSGTNPSRSDSPPVGDAVIVHVYPGFPSVTLGYSNSTPSGVERTGTFARLGKCSSNSTPFEVKRTGISARHGKCSLNSTPFEVERTGISARHGKCSLNSTPFEVERTGISARLGKCSSNSTPFEVERTGTFARLGTCSPPRIWLSARRESGPRGNPGRGAALNHGHFEIWVALGFPSSTSLEKPSGRMGLAA
jgi:hypothetical protein